MVCDMIHVKSHDMTCAIYMLRLHLFQNHMSLSDRGKDGGISACIGFANGERLMVECVMVALGIADMEKVAPVTAGVINTQKEEDPHRTPKMRPLQELEAMYANFWEYALTELSKTPSGRLGCGHPARNLRQLRCSWPTYDLDETELAALRLREQAVERYTIAILSRKVRFSLFPSLERGTTGRKGNKTSIRRAYSKKKSILSWPAHVLQDRLAENLILQATQAFQLRRAEMQASQLRRAVRGGNLLLLKWPTARRVAASQVEEILLRAMQAFQLRKAKVLASSNLKIVEL